MGGAERSGALRGEKREQGGLEAERSKQRRKMWRHGAFIGEESKSYGDVVPALGGRKVRVATL